MWARDPIKCIRQRIRHGLKFNQFPYPVRGWRSGLDEPRWRLTPSHLLSTDSKDDHIVCDISIQADQARLCQAKQAHYLVLEKTEASVAKKSLTASDAPHLNTKALMQKLDEVAKTVDLDVSTTLEEQMKEPVLGTVRSWIRKNTPPDTKSPEIQQSKGPLRCCQEFNRLLIEEEGQHLC